MSDDRVYFNEQRARFALAIGRLATVSNSQVGRNLAPRFAWGSWIYARMVLAGRSVLLLLERYVDHKAHSTVDHQTIGGICRSILEMQIFLSYLIEDGLAEEEWQLRKWTLDIHDCNSRLRLFRSLKSRCEVGAFKEQLDELRDRIKTNPLFAKLPKEAQTDILAGKRLYVRGMRATLAVAGWEQDQWDGIYAYLSGSSHSAPISFYRTVERGMDNLSIVPYQFAFCGFSLEWASGAITWANDRIEKLYPELQDIPRADET